MLSVLRLLLLRPPDCTFRRVGAVRLQRALRAPPCVFAERWALHLAAALALASACALPEVAAESGEVEPTMAAVPQVAATAEQSVPGTSWMSVRSVPLMPDALDASADADRTEAAKERIDAGPLQEAGAPTEVHCPEDACKPGGHCAVHGGEYACECDDGFSGTGSKQCTETNDCPVPDPCFPGGACVDALNAYSCQCGAGYNGSGTRECHDIDDCAVPNACSPGGVCVDGRGSYHCMCDGDVPLGAPPKSCRITQRADEYFDAETGLHWARGFGQVSRINGSPQEYCARVDGGLRRAPTEAEVETISGIELFTETGSACFGTTTHDVCGTGQSGHPDHAAVWCVR